MFSKEQIYNLALNALLLQRQISDTETDKSNECKVLNGLWELAFIETLQDLDLDSTSIFKPLELLYSTNVTDLSDENNWNYIYRYPDKCTLFRRIRSCVVTDNRSTRIPLRIGMYESAGKSIKAIFTNKEKAIGEWIPQDIQISSLESSTIQAIALQLAFLAAPLITGKGADKLRKTVEGQYIKAKAGAQEIDRMENTNFESEATMSEFVQVRLS